MGRDMNLIRTGDTVRRRLATGRLSHRIGTVVTLFDPNQDGTRDAMVRWQSTHKRLANTDTRDHIETLAALVKVDD